MFEPTNGNAVETYSYLKNKPLSNMALCVAVFLFFFVSLREGWEKDLYGTLTVVVFSSTDVFIFNLNVCVSPKSTKEGKWTC